MRREKLEHMETRNICINRGIWRQQGTLLAICHCINGSDRIYASQDVKKRDTQCQLAIHLIMILKNHYTCYQHNSQNMWTPALIWHIFTLRKTSLRTIEIKVTFHALTYGVVNQICINQSALTVWYCQRLM